MDEDVLAFVFASITNEAALIEMLQSLAATFDCQSAVIVYTDQTRPSADIAVAVGPFADFETRQRYYLEFAHLDPAPTALGRLPTGKSASTDLLFSSTMSRYSAFLEGFYYPLGLAGALGGPLIKTNSRVGMIAVHRGPDRDPFDEADVSRLDRIMPSLMRMLELRRTFFELNDTAASLIAAIEPTSAAIMILDERKVLRQANSAARRLVAKGSGLKLDHNGLLTVDDPKANVELQAAICARRSQTKPSIVRVPRSDGQAPVVLRVVPNPDRASLTIYASDPDRVDRSQADSLAGVLKVSQTCAELVCALLDGETLEAYAARRGITKNTAKYHLRTAFAATSTRRQSELVLYVARMVHDVAL